MDDEGKNAVVDSTGPISATFEDFKSKMPVDEPRWGVYALEWKTLDERQMSKVIFLMYAPDSAKDKKARFVYANAKEHVRKKIDPVNKEFQINDHSDIKEQEFIEDFE